MHVVLSREMVAAFSYEVKDEGMESNVSVWRYFGNFPKYRQIFKTRKIQQQSKQFTKASQIGFTEQPSSNQPSD